MATGTIKTLVRDRGFGFIMTDGSTEDIFFHSTSVANAGFDALSEGQKVEFDKEADPRNASRSRATNVRVS
jgi:CspA family cold shock protein